MCAVTAIVVLVVYYFATDAITMHTYEGGVTLRGESKNFIFGTKNNFNENPNEGLVPAIEFKLQHDMFFLLV